MSDNIIKYDFNKKIIMESAIESKDSSKIRKAIEFSKSLLSKFTFKASAKVIVKKTRIVPVYHVSDNFDGVGYEIYIDGKKQPYVWYHLGGAEKIAKLLAVEYIMEIEAEKS